MESESKLYHLFDALFFARTGIDPGSSPGQAFAEKRDKIADRRCQLVPAGAAWPGRVPGWTFAFAQFSHRSLGGRRERAGVPQPAFGAGEERMSGNRRFKASRSLQGI
ncbi:MAG TPA: hypothetical protein VHB49_05295 [Bradyrhizobium sp.]|nr:hypothetical protein [Bradyrhizobium sp.]